MQINCQQCMRRYDLPDATVRGRKLRARCKCGACVIIEDPQRRRSADSSTTGSIQRPVRWFVEISSSEPIAMDLKAVIRAFEAGRIDPETQVWRKGMAGWARLREVPELADLLLSDTSAAPLESARGEEGPPERPGPDSPPPLAQQERGRRSLEPSGPPTIAGLGAVREVSNEASPSEKPPPVESGRGRAAESRGHSESQAHAPGRPSFLESASLRAQQRSEATPNPAATAPNAPPNAALERDGAPSSRRPPQAESYSAGRRNGGRRSSGRPPRAHRINADHTPDQAAAAVAPKRQSSGPSGMWPLVGIAAALLVGGLFVLEPGEGDESTGGGPYELNRGEPSQGEAALRREASPSAAATTVSVSQPLPRAQRARGPSDRPGADPRQVRRGAAIEVSAPALEASAGSAIRGLPLPNIEGPAANPDSAPPAPAPDSARPAPVARPKSPARGAAPKLAAAVDRTPPANAPRRASRSGSPSAPPRPDGATAAREAARSAPPRQAQRVVPKAEPLPRPKRPSPSAIEPVAPEQEKAPPPVRTFQRASAEQQAQEAAQNLSHCAPLGEARGAGTVEIRLAPWGTVQRVRHMTESYVGTKLGLCIMQAFQGITVPRFDGPSQTVVAAFYVK